jgi:sulfite reductase (NADPH) flavoprotein alpha-component
VPGGLAVAASGDALALGPLPAPLAEEVRQLVARLDAGQRLWLSGYLAGVLASTAGPVAPVEAAPAAKPVTVLFGSQSGNAERVARQAAAHLEQQGVRCVVLDMMDCGKAELAAAHTLLVVVSTQGEGDPPDRAIALWELLQGRRAPSLAHLRFSVLALGDTS